MLSLALVLLILIYSGIVGCVLAVAAIVALEIVVFWHALEQIRGS